MSAGLPDDLLNRIITLEEQQGVLVDEMRFMQQHLEDAAARFNHLLEEVAWVRKRLAQVFPEQHHCPKCKRLVNKQAKACKCGASWGPRTVEGGGLPNE